MKNEFTLAFNEVLSDKQLPHEVVVEAIESAMVSAYRKAVNASTSQLITATIDSESGEVHIYAEKEVVEEVFDDRTEVTLKEALKVEPETELGNLVSVDSTPDNFGRVAAQTARQVIQQRIREAERQAQFDYFTKQVGNVINGIVQATNMAQVTLGLEKKAEGIMPRKEQIPGERFRMYDRVRALLLEVKDSPRGPQIILTRGHRNFLRRLLEDEVPEIYHGLVEIRSISREPGQRSKVSVAALQAGIDPVGACVGVRGVRIQAIVRELNDEKIDVIEWNPEPTEYIAKALSPARVVGVYLDKHSTGAKTATVVVPEDQLSLAIGRDGQNARLAAKLTGWRIDIKSLLEAAADSLTKVNQDPDFAEFKKDVDASLPHIEAILLKKTEGRPITPEEYSVVGQFVQRVEQGAIEKLEADKLAEKEYRDTLRSAIPPQAFAIPIEELGIPVRLCIVLGGEGYTSIGDLLFQIAIDSDEILAINGIGPKAMQDIETKLAEFEYPEPEVEPEPEPEPVLAAEVTPEAEEITEVEAVEEAVEAESAVEVAAPEPVEETLPEPEVEASFEEMLSKSTGFVADPELEELDDKKDKKKKKRFHEVEYDPDHDITLVRRKRKRGGNEEWLDDLGEDW